jgi:CheY-like chemotaxis protein
MQKILIVDDNAAVRSTISKILADAGYCTVSAEDGNSGLDVYKRERPDLIITDIIMPEREGIETIRTMLKDNPQAKIIAISGGARIGKMDLLQVARRMGARETMAKPFDPDELVATTKRLLAA